MAQQEETFRCGTCKDIKSITLKVKGIKQCKKCHQMSYSKATAKYREKNSSFGWVRPLSSKCSDCKEILNGKFFALNPGRCNGLNNLCKYCSTKRRSKHNMKLNRKEFHYLLNLPCYYCGGSENIGVDRVFNEEVYTKENCVSCCWTCNKFKLSLDGDKFLNVIEKIYNHRVTKIISICNELDS